ncbi:hypothetical protein RJO15_20720 [Herbaspirillum huttiense F1]|uniref:hypothetical protein n=1 Tax=Herbaspirillum TaxID=963 RepID=UPI0028616BDC|nr:MULTISPECIES: hypothetical protein [Herbaspirillum]MDR6738556.1 hypothetical protein [Herbaspirillum sp. 1173]MDT0358223.1 hypothetical protein [Herbaspirillum huttiense F1]
MTDLVPEPAPPILSQAFLDWWFAPWQYLDLAVLPGMSATLVARRDSYRAWCERAALAPDLPRLFNPGWQSAASQQGLELRRRAGLFGGLFAAREHQQSVLGTLTRDQQTWCQRISLAQPLTRCVPRISSPDGAQADAVLVGLAELAWRLQQHFPGMWARLRGLLDPSERSRIDSALPAAAQSPVAESAAAARRALRCWQSCCTRAQQE